MTAITLPANSGAVAVDTISAESHQLMKVEFGAAGSATQVSAANPLPVTVSTALPTGTNTVGAVAPSPNASAGPTAFTASDAVVAAPVGDGTLVTGASTAGSVVSLAIPSGFTAWTVLVKNWTNGTIYSEASFNSTNGTDGDWIDVKGRRTGTAPGVESVLYAIVANGYYRGNGAGFSFYRLRFIGASTFPTVQITLTEAQGATFLNSGIPAGSSLLGKVGIDQTTPGSTNAVQFTNTTLAVTGTFYQATQPVSFTWAGLTDTQLRASAVPVSLTSTTITGSVAVTGPLTDTQLRAVAVPVSLTSTTVTGSVAVTGPLTDTQLRAVAVPVSLASTTITGTVAATQSGTWNIGSITTLPALATGANTIGAVTGPAAAALALDATLTGGTLKAIARTAAKGTAIAADLTSNPVDANTQALHVNLAGTNAVNATLSAETTKVIGTINIAAAQTVAAVTAITNALPTGANTIGAVNIAASQTLATVTTVGAVTAITNALPAGANKIGTVDIATAAATAKGTQGANALPTQDLKDAGRNAITFYTLIPVLTTATDTLQSLTGTKTGATVTATTTPAVVTTGKTLRITRISAAYVATATSGYGMVRLRFNTAGVVAVASPIAATLIVGAGNPATANAVDTVEAAMDEGWEFAAATGIGISVQGFAAVTATAVGYVMVSVTGYEY